MNKFCVLAIAASVLATPAVAQDTQWYAAIKGSPACVPIDGIDGYEATHTPDQFADMLRSHGAYLIKMGDTSHDADGIKYEMVGWQMTVPGEKVQSRLLMVFDNLTICQATMKE